MLGTWRNVLPPQLAWSDDDPPSPNINIARLRAKYYGGHYMILRPFLYILVHKPQINNHVANSTHNSSPAVFPEPSATPPTLSRMPSDYQAEQNDEITQAAHICVESAIKSTIAFDCVNPDKKAPPEYKNFVSQRKCRLIVPNIFGTLHAQFGNMIVLAAVFQSDLRCKFLPHDSHLTHTNLSALFVRTMNILSELQGNSPILRMDLRILENVKRRFIDGIYR